MKVSRTSQVAQPLSATAYALIALAGLAIGAAFTGFYIFSANKMAESATQDRIYYLLLIPWALSSATFLFGAMRSFALTSHRQLGTTVELGGPVALFALVLVGGFKLVPQAPQTFDLTIRAHSSDGAAPLITEGSLTLELGTTTPSERLGPKGEAIFKGVSTRFKGATIKILPTIDGYRQEWQEQRLTGEALDLELTKAELPTTQLTGSVTPPPRGKDEIRISVEGQAGDVLPDSRGRFSISVRGKVGDSVHVIVFKNGALAYDDTQTLPGPVTLLLSTRQ
jgi:hypothetical protein